MNAIYGAGEYGKLLYSFLLRKKFVINFFVQTELNEKSRLCCGIPIISKADLLRIESVDLTVYISLHDRIESIKIKQSLIDEGKGLMEILECGEFIRNNFSGEQIDKAVYTGNNYEQNLSRNYWSELPANYREGKVFDSLVQGLSSDSKELVKHVIDRMSSFPSAGDDIFTIEEKKGIRKQEREFVHRVNVEEINKRKWKEWRGYRIPYEVYMEPTVFYYKCGACAIKIKNKLEEGILLMQVHMLGILL